MKKCFLLIGVLCFFVTSFAAVENQYPFQSTQKMQQFQRLTNELRCMVCQNESIASSTADFAADMRGKVYQMVKAGKSDHEIEHYMVSRYGNFILFKPPLVQETYLLWFAPALLFLLGAVICCCIIRKYRGR